MARGYKPPSRHRTAMRAIFALAVIAVALTGCRKKKSGGKGDDASDFTGDIPTIVSGTQPTSGSGAGSTPFVPIGPGTSGAQPPGTFRITGPSATTSTAPTVAWTASSRAATYDIKIARNPTCRDIVASAAALRTTSWRVTPALAAGSYYVCVSARNSYGALAATNNAMSLTVSPHGGEGSEDGPSGPLTVSALAAINVLNQASYTISGSCEVDGSNINVTLVDSSVAPLSMTAQTVCTGGAWSTSIDGSSFSDGTVLVTVETGDPDAVTFIRIDGTTFKDSVVPTVTLNPVSSTITQASVTAVPLSGTCSEADGTVSITVDDTQQSTAAVSYASTCSNSSWSAALDLSSLADGLLHFVVTHQDRADNNASTTGSATKDATAPASPETFALNSPASNVSNSTNIQFRFTGLALGEVVRVWSDAACTTQVTTGTASGPTLNVNTTLSTDGTYHYHATVEDPLGNRSACTATAVTYTLDRVISPLTSMTLQTPTSSPGNTRTPTVTVNGSAPGDTVRIFWSSSCFASDQLGFAVTTGTSVNVTVDPGYFTLDTTYRIYARSSDAAGNHSSCTTFFVSYQLDTQAPAAPTSISRTTPVSSPGMDTEPTFTVSGVATGFPVALYRDSGCLALLNSGTANDTSFTLSSGPLANDGPYTIYATQTDLAGNRSPCSTTFATYTLDASPPTLSNIRIESGGGKAVAGRHGYAIISFDASEPLATHDVVILGRNAAVSNPQGLSYRAVLQLLWSDPSGPVTFTIDYTDVLANAGPQVTASTDGSVLTYDATNYAPVPVIANQTGAEASLLSFDINDAHGDGSGDLDGNGQAVTYNRCYYDQTVNGVVAASAPCSALGAFSLNAATGVAQWTPSYTQAGTYEFRVIATDGTVDGEAVFTVTIANTNRNPVLSSIPNRNLALKNIFSFDVNDAQTLSDYDIDGEAITYTCAFDTTIDSSVGTGSSCTDLAGVNFNGNTGFFTWTVQPSTPGDFEFKITGRDPLGGTGERIFHARVTIDISRIPQLCMVGDNTTSYFSSLGDQNEVVIEDTNGHAVFTQTKQAGDIFTFNTYPGYKLICSEGCFAITPTQGTAAWSTQSYAGTLLSTYWGRNNRARVVIAAFDQDATFSINANFGSGDVELANGFAARESIVNVDLTNNPFVQTALWIQSDAPISAYISTSNNNTLYDQDGRVITAAAKEALAFVSGGGGTPSAVTTTQNNTSVSVYQNGKSAPTVANNLMINQILIVTDAAAQQNPASTAVAIYANKPVVSTQHADGDGVNSTPSLPKSMLSTHFVIPMDGDYVSFASYENGEVIQIDPTGTVVARHPMIAPMVLPNPPLVPGGPYAFSYPDLPRTNPLVIPAGTRFVCSKPCMGIVEPQVNDDETLMTGTTKDPMTLATTSFQNGGTIPLGFKGNQAGRCSGANDFPDLHWANLPWGTKRVAVIIEDETNGHHVNLILTDIPSGTTGLAHAPGMGAPFTLDEGTNGLNGDGISGWSGPCASGAAYRFKAFALSGTIGTVDNMNIATFEATYANSILGSASITGNTAP